MDYQRVLEFISGSFEILPSKLKKFENSLKLPRVLFSISLIIYNFKSVRKTISNFPKITPEKLSLDIDENNYIGKNLHIWRFKVNKNM